MIAAVCQPLAARPRKSSPAAASYRMKRFGSKIGGKSLSLRCFERMRPDRKVCPGSKAGSARQISTAWWLRARCQRTGRLIM